MIQSICKPRRSAAEEAGIECKHILYVSSYIFMQLVMQYLLATAEFAGHAPAFYECNH